MRAEQTVSEMVCRGSWRCCARHITETNSGHYVHRERPRLVIDSVREVAGAVHKKAWTLGFKNRGQCIKSEEHARRQIASQGQAT